MNNDIFSINEELVRREPGAALAAAVATAPDPQVRYLIDVDHSRSRAAVEMIKSALAS